MIEDSSLVLPPGVLVPLLAKKYTILCSDPPLSGRTPYKK